MSLIVFGLRGSRFSFPFLFSFFSWDVRSFFPFSKRYEVQGAGQGSGSGWRLIGKIGMLRMEKGGAGAC